MKTRVVAYCRVSTEKEAQLQSLAAQKEFFQNYAAEKGYELVGIYADEGLSGTKLKIRTQFLQMMKDAEARKFDLILVKDVSRLARNTADLLSSIRRLQALEIGIFFITLNIRCTNQHEGELLVTLMGAMAQEESAGMSKRIKFGKRINAAKGKVPNLIYGYDRIEKDYFNLKINENEAAIVRLIFHKYLEEGAGALRIAMDLNRKGIKTRRGCDWSQNAICRILTNQIYDGCIVNHKSEISNFLTSSREKIDKAEWLTVNRPELRLIGHNDFLKAQELLASRNELFKTGKGRASNKYLFSTLIKCKNCGYSFTRLAHTRQYGQAITWECSSHHAKGGDGCGNKTVVKDFELKAYLEKYFCKKLNEEREITAKSQEEFLRLYTLSDHGAKDTAALKQQLDKLDRKRAKYLDAYSEETITKDEYLAKMQELNEQKQALEQEKRIAELNISREAMAGENLKEAFAKMKDLTDLENVTNTQLKEVVDRIEVDHEGNVDIFLKALKALEDKP